MDTMTNMLMWLAIVIGSVGGLWLLVIGTIMYFKYRAERYIAEKGQQAYQFAKDKVVEHIGDKS